MIDYDFDYFKDKIRDPLWRISNLYKIMIKGDQGETDLVVTFKPTDIQLSVLKSLHNKNVILKARQLGMTTNAVIFEFDHALFNPNSRCGIIANNKENAKTILRDKVKFAYDHLPPALKEHMPLAASNADELLFGHNNSSIRVSTSMRSGTLHRLHVSEFGSICRHYPQKAAEVMSGSIPAVTTNGILIIESTAEGRDGDFYRICQQAIANKQSGKKLTPLDYKMHFFPWFVEPGYKTDPSRVIITDKDNEYFDRIEQEEKVVISKEQRAWYVSKRNSDFTEKPEIMWQEYPSTAQEAFQKSTEGCYYAGQIARARQESRICGVAWEPNVPVNTFWDLGTNDQTAIWFHQRVGTENRFICYYEYNGESYSHYVNFMQKTGYIWGSHYLPHDGGHVRMAANNLSSPIQELTKLGLRSIMVNQKITRVMDGIQMARDVFSSCYFDEKKCKEGLIHLENYRKEWDAKLGVWRDHPRHDIHSNGADAFRTFAEGYAEPMRRNSYSRQETNWKVM